MDIQQQHVPGERNSVQPRHASTPPESVAPSNHDSPSLSDTTASPVIMQTQAQAARQNRHSKRLSLNFPIVIPNVRRFPDSPAHSGSPVMTPASSGSMLQLSAQTTSVHEPTSSILQTPLTPPSESPEDKFPRPASPNRRPHVRVSHTRSHTLAHTELNHPNSVTLQETSPSESITHLDFLTLLAGQERRVLELKEELLRAETELQALKKQWAVHEATRKKTELKNGGSVKLETLRSPQTTEPQRSRTDTHARSATISTAAGLGLGLAIDEETESGEGADSEREKRRSLMQERFRKRGTTLENGSATPSLNGKRNGQRVFSGSRHTRTLSLLTTTPNLSTNDSQGDTPASALTRSSLASGGSTNGSSADFQAPSLPSLTRSNSGFGRDLNFGKTYKDLASAASRRTIPQGADVLMKHGRVVVDGVRDGLWSFFEDIRQATVGEEAARETTLSNESGHGVHRQRSAGSSKATMKNGAMGTTKIERKSPSEQSFWREFGVETPKGNRTKSVGNVDGVTNPKVKTASSSCIKHGHEEHSMGSSQPSGLETRSVLSNPTSLATPNKESSVVTQSNSHHHETQARKEHHVSHSSTDSGDSRDSRNPPSLTMDSPFGGSSRNNDTDVDDGEDDETWDWKESDSPVQVRAKAMHSNNQVAPDEPSSTDLDGSTIVDVSSQNRGRGDSQGYEWHALTR